MIAVYKSGLAKLRNGIATHRSSGVFIKGVKSNIVGGIPMDLYYGVKQTDLDERYVRLLTTYRWGPSEAAKT